MTEARPAFYALAQGGWRDYVTLLHPPYTAWHLSYVAIGATLAPQVHWDRLGAAVAAFFLALGVAAHALDELNGRPLATRIPDRTLVALTVVSLSGAVAIGIAGAASFDVWLLVFVAVGAALLLTGYFACAGTIAWEALLAAAFAALLSLAQRLLSTQVRHVRRRVATVGGTIELRDGAREPIGPETLTAAPEAALRALAAATVCLALALVVLRLT